MGRMTDIGPMLVIALSCLVVHWATITSLVDDLGQLPEGHPLIRLWRAGNRRPERDTRWANVLIAGAFGIVATPLMIVALFGGSYMTLIVAVVLSAAGMWLTYLPRHRRAHVLPILPGKEEADLNVFERFKSEDASAFGEWHRSHGVHRHAVWHQKTPDGTVAIVLLEADDTFAELPRRRSHSISSSATR